MEIYQVNKICRCCLQSNGQMKPLYGLSLDEMLRSIAGFEVRPNDGHPELVCFQCVLQLSRAFRFKAQCQKSNKIMLEFLKRVPDVEIHDSHFESFCEENNDVLNTEDDPILLVDEKPLERLNNNCEIEEKCSTCDKIFNTRKKLERHIKTHNKKTVHKCSQCLKEFSQTSNLKRHQILKHTDAKESNSIKQHSCSVCGKQFKYSSSLFKHNKIHTGNNLLHCPSCPKYFLENTTFKSHLRTHTGDRPFVCPSCNKTFTNSSNFNKHKRSHSDRRPFDCNICKRTFSERNYLKRHMNIHHKTQSVLCSQCGKHLATAKGLNAHMRLHTNYHKIYKCGFENCDKTFSRTDTAAIHRMIHTGEKPHFCDKCCIGFKTKNQLLIHSKTHHFMSQAELPGLLSEDVRYNIQGEGGNRKMIEESLLLFTLNENEECSFLTS